MSQLKLTIVGDPQPLRTATKKAEASLRQMNKVASSVSASMNKSFGALGLGIGLATLVNGLKNATKAASEDRKAQGLLANALQKTVGATSQAIAGAEQYIKQTQLSTSVLDDELRPALAKAVRATGSLADGQRLLDIALDISAETGKDLGSVTGALNKAYNGQTASLKKLIPGIQLTDDWMGDLEQKFQGTAEKAADLDPYKKLEVVFAELQETVGAALLPALEEFTAYIVSPDGQQNLQQIVDGFVNVGKAIVDANKFLVENIGLVKAIIGTLVTLRIGWSLSTGLVNLYTAATGRAVSATRLLKTALVSTGIGAILVGLGFVAESFIPKEDELATESGQIPMSPTQDTLGPRAISDTVIKIKTAGRKIKAAIQSNITSMQDTAEKFRDTVGVAFGAFGEDEYTVFNVDYFKGKLQRMVAAAKGFAGNLKKILKTPGSEQIVNELIGMGPAAGNIAAKALLASGDLKEIVGLQKSLYNTGAQVGAVSAVAGNATYEININKATVSAADIIKEIRLLEKKTGRKYLVG
jgi:hypothetical protein